MWRLCVSVCVAFFFFKQKISINPTSIPPQPPQPISGETSPPPTKKKKQQQPRCGQPLGNLESVFDPFPSSSEFILPAAVMTQTWCFCGAGRFSYGELPLTPSLEGTSLHRRNTSVERPWGILSLFTTCFRLRMIFFCQRLT